MQRERCLVCAQGQSTWLVSVNLTALPVPRPPHPSPPLHPFSPFFSPPPLPLPPLPPLPLLFLLSLSSPSSPSPLPPLPLLSLSSSSSLPSGPAHLPGWLDPVDSQWRSLDNYQISDAEVSQPSPSASSFVVCFPPIFLPTLSLSLPSHFLSRVLGDSEGEVGGD